MRLPYQSQAIQLVSMITFLCSFPGSRGSFQFLHSNLALTSN